MAAVTYSAEVAASGNNYAHDGSLLIVLCNVWRSSAADSVVTGVTFGGVALTEIQSQYKFYGSDSSDTWCGYLVTPPATSALTLNGTGNLGTLYGISCSGISLSNPIVDSSALDSDGADTIDCMIGGLAFCVCATRQNGHTPIAGTSEYYDEWIGGNNHGNAGGYATPAGSTIEIGWNSVAGGFCFFSLRPASPAAAMWWS